MAGELRNLALFNLAIDSKLRSCDLVKLRIADVTHAGQLASRAKVMQQKTGLPVQFEISPETRESISAWLDTGGSGASDFLFPSRLKSCDHISTQQ